MAQDAIDEFIALPRDQQLSTLQQLSPERQDKLLATIKQRRTKPAPPAETPITPRSFNERLTTPTSPEARSAHPVISAASDFGAGAIQGAEQLVTRPLQTAQASGQMLGDLMTVAFPNGQPDEKLTASRQRLREQLAAAKANPAFTAGQLVGGFEAGEGVAKAGGKALDTVGSRVTEIATGTGPGATADLVKETQKTNLAEGEKTAKFKANEAEKGSLQQEIGEKSRGLQARIETAREGALKVGNEKYSAVNEKLSPLPADMEKLQNAHSAAAEAMGEAGAQPAILNRLGKELEHGQQLHYSDEQALYSELGKELSKGTLGGRLYHAYDLLHDAIGEDMQRLADSQGIGAMLTEARAYWKRMKQTFGKPLSTRDAATKTLRTVSPEFTKQEELANRLRLLSHYDPEIGTTAQDVTKARSDVKALPKLEPGAEPKKIGTEDIRQAKAEGLENRAKLIEHRGTWVAAWPLFHIMSQIIHGDIVSLPADIAASGATYAGVQGVAAILRNPTVVEFLTKATPRDITQVPANLRGDMPTIISTAQKQGVKVSPALLGAVMGSRNYPLGPNTRKLKQTSDELRATPQ